MRYTYLCYIRRLEAEKVNLSVHVLLALGRAHFIQGSSSGSQLTSETQSNGKHVRSDLNIYLIVLFSTAVLLLSRFSFHSLLPWSHVHGGRFLFLFMFVASFKFAWCQHQGPPTKRCLQTTAYPHMADWQYTSNRTLISLIIHLECMHLCVSLRWSVVSCISGRGSLWLSCIAMCRCHHKMDVYICQIMN